MTSLHLPIIYVCFLCFVCLFLCFSASVWWHFTCNRHRKTEKQTDKTGETNINYRQVQGSRLRMKLCESMLCWDSSQKPTFGSNLDPIWLKFAPNFLNHSKISSLGLKYHRKQSEYAISDKPSKSKSRYKPAT